jgi:hypothetical protein
MLKARLLLDAWSVLLMCLFHDVFGLGSVALGFGLGWAVSTCPGHVSWVACLVLCCLSCLVARCILLMCCGTSLPLVRMVPVARPVAAPHGSEGPVYHGVGGHPYQSWRKPWRPPPASCSAPHALALQRRQGQGARLTCPRWPLHVWPSPVTGWGLHVRSPPWLRQLEITSPVVPSDGNAEVGTRKSIRPTA